jgi:hypothetical protein
MLKHVVASVAMAKEFLQSVERRDGRANELYEVAKRFLLL